MRPLAHLIRKLNVSDDSIEEDVLVTRIETLEVRGFRQNGGQRREFPVNTRASCRV